MSPPLPRPGHPLVGRQRHLVTLLRGAVVLAVVLATAGMLLPGRAGDLASNATIAVLVATPLVRILWLVVRWIRRGDRRFAVVGLSLLVVVAVAAVSGG